MVTPMNDNNRKQASPNEARTANGHTITVLTNLPEKMPVVDGEVSLLSTYFSSLLTQIAANDNLED